MKRRLLFWVNQILPSFKRVKNRCLNRTKLFLKLSNFFSGLAVLMFKRGLLLFFSVARRDGFMMYRL